MLSICVKLLQWWRYVGLCSTVVPHAYSVSQLLPSHVYLSSNRHRKSAQIHVYTLGLDNWVLLCSQHVSNCFNDEGILDSALQWYHTHIRSPNHCHRMCICQEKATEKALKFTFIHTGSRIECFHALNPCQTASMMKVFWTLLYSGNPRKFGLPTTVIACVLVKH